MIELSLDDEPSDHLGAVLERARIDDILAQARELYVADAVKQSAVQLLLATHPEHPGASPQAQAHIRYGASPRGLQALLRAARTCALLEGRAQVAFEDLQRVALPALRHRVLLKMESEMDGIEVDGVLTDILRQCLPAR
jgi:MoxR-like ATPase